MIDIEQANLMTKKVNIVLDASQIDMFQLCEERFHNRYILNKGTAVKAKQLDRGTVIHSGYEVYYKQLKDGISLKYALPETLNHIKRVGAESDLDPTEVGRIVEVAEENLTNWECEDIGFQILAVEEPFLYLLHEDDVLRLYMSGKIDLLVNWNTNKTYYESLPIDHKSYDRKYPIKRRSTQFMNYAVATKSNYLLVNRIGFQTSLKPEEKHIRAMQSYDPEYLEINFKQNIIKIANRYINCVANDSWEMNNTSCDKFNRTCEYDEVCDSSGREAKLFKLSSNLVDVEAWDVTKLMNKSQNEKDKSHT